MSDRSEWEVGFSFKNGCKTFVKPLNVFGPTLLIIFPSNTIVANFSKPSNIQLYNSKIVLPLKLNPNNSVNPFNAFLVISVILSRQNWSEPNMVPPDQF